MCFQTLQKIQFFGCCLIISWQFHRLRNSSLKNFEIREDQFQIDRLNISERINTSVYMDDICIFKASYYMNDCIYLPDIGKELISKTLSFWCTFYKTCDIYKLDGCRDDLLCMIHLSQHIKTLVRHCYNSHVRVDRTEWIIGWLCSCLCQRIK